MRQIRPVYLKKERNDLMRQVLIYSGCTALCVIAEYNSGRVAAHEACLRMKRAYPVDADTH